MPYVLDPSCPRDQVKLEEPADGIWEWGMMREVMSFRVAIFQGHVGRIVVS